MLYFFMYLFAYFIYFLYLCTRFDKNYSIMNIADVIHKYGYTVREVSRALGKHERTLDVMIAKSRSTTNSFTVATLRAIADVIGCHVSEFLADEPVTKNGVIIPPPEKGEMVLDLKKAIIQSGIPQRDIAKKIGISDVAMSVMVKNGNPTYSRMCDVAKALGVQVTDLFFEVEKPKKGRRKK